MIGPTTYPLQDISSERTPLLPHTSKKSKCCARGLSTGGPPLLLCNPFFATLLCFFSQSSSSAASNSLMKVLGQLCKNDLLPLKSPESQMALLTSSLTSQLQEAPFSLEASGAKTVEDNCASKFELATGRMAAAIANSFAWLLGIWKRVFEVGELGSCGTVLKTFSSTSVIMCSLSCCRRNNPISLPGCRTS